LWKIHFLKKKVWDTNQIQDIKIEPFSMKQLAHFRRILSVWLLAVLGYRHHIGARNECISFSLAFILATSLVSLVAINHA
jgi:hypothetical protein